MPASVIADIINLGVTTVRGIVRGFTSIKSYPLFAEYVDLLAESHRLHVVKARITAELDSYKGLVTAPRMVKVLKAEDDIEVKPWKVRRLMADDMDLVYRHVGSVASYVNSRKNIVLRQHFARHLAVNVFARGRVFVNFDECTFLHTSSRAMSWSRRGPKTMRTFKEAVPAVNLFLAITTDGDRFFQFLTGTNNQVTFCSWLIDLVGHFNRTRPDWRTSHCLCLDNMSGHKSELALAVIRHLEIPVTFTAPASMTAMPIERVFGLVKN